MAALSLNELAYLLAPHVNLKNPKGEDAVCCKFAQFLKYNSLAGKLDAVWTYVPNEWTGRNQYCYETPQKAKGKISGFSDFIFVWNRGGGFIEAKTDKGVQSDVQKLFQRWCEMHGLDYRLMRSFEEGVDIIREWGILRG